MPWTCPECKRRFGRSHQSHECAPALTVADYLKTQPKERHSTYRAVLRVLKAFPDVDIDPVKVGIMIKRARTFCELRPRRNAVGLSFKVSRPLGHPRIHKQIQTSANRIAYFVDLKSPEEVDEQIQEWIAESYLDSPS